MALSNSQDSGLSVVWVTFFTFLILKLCGVIDWSWWWVTAPIWGFTILLFGFALVLTVWQLRTEKRKKDRIIAGQRFRPRT